MSNPKQPQGEKVAADQRKGINHHFRREGKLMAWLFVGGPVILTVGGFFLGYVIQYFSR
ncbi:MAG: hypothetical protein JOY84_01625 [Curvibacter sp.]|nr:hypothetical protein [Curvibacter sp.]